MNAEALKAISESMSGLNAQLNRITGQLFRDQGANIIPSFSQELFLDNTTTKERPIQKIAFDFKSMTFTDGTDNDTYIYAILGRVNGSKIPAKFKNNGTYVSDFQVSEVTLFSPAQAGKKITVNLYRDAIVTTGSLVNSGTVTTSPNTAMEPLNNQAIGAAAAGLLLASDPSTKEVTIQNNHSASIWVGPSNVTNAGATCGLEIVPGGNIKFRNTAAIYCYSVAGFSAGKVTVLKET